jgi:predicted nuclease of restriction endonuclease-like (RecB) superfamily
MNYYNEIKENLINNEVYKAIKDYSKNRSDLETYYKVGKLLSEAGKHYGECIIKEYSVKLSEELGKKYSYRTLFRFKQFYNLFKNQKVSALPTQLTWSHFIELLILKDFNEINYYIVQCQNQNITYRELRTKIKSHEYERLPEETKTKLIKQEQPNIKDLVLCPIIIKNKNNMKIINEKILHQLILENISSFMKELGDGYSFIDSEYKIKLGNNYNFIDLLLFNYVYNCFVIIELKVTELKKEYMGQIALYMNYIDKNVKAFNHDKTIGIVIVKKNNKFVMEYCSDSRIIAREYIVC